MLLRAHFSHYLMVGLGGGLGSILRVFTMTLFPSSLAGIPLQIMAINIIGCLAMGILTEAMAFILALSDAARYFWISGFLGGFTTFSSFALDFGLLWERGEVANALFYAFLTTGLSLIAFIVGMKGLNWAIH